ncbi:hypothetical protein T190115A13A_40196 [Tenacibaculum sp. 190524A02b]|uniref:Uncharacterized protein n=1 Tax=Tenacibaculum vairaonense TaxID=3137860 RepID=A0ABP1FHL7_9FLAO
MNVLQNHQRLLTIVEAYANIYKEDLHNNLLANEITQALSEGHEIQKQGKLPWLVYHN